MNKKLVFIVIIMCFCHQIIKAQEIYTYEIASKKEGFEKILNTYSAVSDCTKILIFAENFQEQKKIEKRVAQRFFSHFKTKLDEQKIIKKMKSGLEFTYSLFFDENGKLEYLLYSVDPETTKYKLNKKNKIIFENFLIETIKNFESEIPAMMKYRIYAGFIQRK